MAALSTRILRCVKALPLQPGMRVLEIGCGPGVAAREVAVRIGEGFVLGIDRSQKAIALAEKGSNDQIEAGTLAFLCAAIEEFDLPRGMTRFDLAFALRVGALDGRNPAAGQRAIERLRSVMTPHARLFVDGGTSLREIDVLS